MTKPTITLSEIENQTGPDFLGYVVNWRLMNIRVQEADLKIALERAGFSNHLPALPTPRKALRRALEAWIAERTQQQTAALDGRPLPPDPGSSMSLALRKKGHIESATLSEVEDDEL